MNSISGYTLFLPYYSWHKGKKWALFTKSICLLTTEKMITTELSFIPCICSPPSMESWFMWKFSLFEELQGSSFPNITYGIIWNIKICCSLKHKIFLSSPVMRLDVAIFTVKRKTLSQMCFEWILDSQWSCSQLKWNTWYIHYCLFSQISKYKDKKDRKHCVWYNLENQS